MVDFEDNNTSCLQLQTLNSAIFVFFYFAFSHTPSLSLRRNNKKKTEGEVSWANYI